MSNTVGYGVGGAVGLVTESVYGTHPGSGDVYVPFLSEGIKGNRNVVPSGSITGDRSVRRRMAGTRMGQGAIKHEMDGSLFGQMFHYWNGSASGALTSTALGATKGKIASFTATPGAGGTLPDGAYKYKVASMWQRTSDSKVFTLPATAEQSATAGTGNNTVALAWSAPTGVPDGFTYYGTTIYRTAAAGATNTQKFLAVVVGAGTSYSNDDTTAITATITPYTASPYEHVFTRAFTPGTNPLPSFSATVLKDNDNSERYLGARMNKFELAVGDGNAPVTANFELMARDFISVANPSPSVTSLSKFMSWQGLVSIDGTQSEAIEGVTITGNNNCQLIPGLSGQPRMRDVGYGQREVTGTLARGFEDHDLWDKMYAGASFDIRLECSGQPLALAATGTTYEVPISGGYAYPLEYLAIVDVFNCKVSEAGANIGGPGRMVESINWGAEVDDTEGTELRLRLYNLTSSYS